MWIQPPPPEPISDFAVIDHHPGTAARKQLSEMMANHGFPAELVTRIHEEDQLVRQVCRPDRLCMRP